ncbi:hypothetical protein HYDPIDRAFT_92649 [Hydnomerulius pinastri MD-312]|uniref:Centrosomin N-terminal motif 1 domain-containing protein n=1 Tax=Hydnomerulius pinastri MD-312 TaxID=994086 RepID=A0A0C9VYH4_9AGAM|nr:hypothetical protein HYDPIDRAFT_92649 [Hydnomerulius pinastri MD-312]
MSAALNARGDSSNQSMGTLPDLSLGSLVSGISTPGRNLRVPSVSSQTTAPSSAPLSTPSPPDHGTTNLRKRLDEPGSALRRLGLSGHDEELDNGDGGGFLDTPGAKWGDGPETPVAARKRPRASAPGGGKGVTLTLRDQEKHIDNLKKENFNVKLRVHFLEERLAQLAPDQVDAALKQNVSLKVEVQQRGFELKKLKRLVLELERELERSQRERGSGGSSRDRERDLEAKLQERERELRELRRGRVSAADEDALRQAELRNEELEEELENVRGLLEDNMEELERLREIVERRGDESIDERGENRRERWQRKLEELEAENEDLRARIEDQNELLLKKEDEKEDLADEIAQLGLEIEEIQRKREAESIERSESRAQILEEREEREAVEEDFNAIRDKLAATMIELSQKEDEIELKNKDIDDLVAEHDRIVAVVEEEWRGEVEEARGQVEELRDALAERETESKELRLNISELEANTNELHAKFEATLQHLEKEADEKDAELEAANREIEKLSDQVYLLEEENDRIKEESDRLREDDAVEQERLQALAAALKEKVNTLKTQLQDLQDLYDQTCQDIHAHRSRQEELARHVEDLVVEVKNEREERERIEQDFFKAEKEFDSELRHERRNLEFKESALQSALDNLAKTETLLEQRQSDLKAVQDALKANEEESKKLGDSHTTAKFSLQLEVDRLKRDIQNLEDALARARQDIGSREGNTRERDLTIDKLHNEVRDLTTRLGNQTQARLHLSDKLDTSQAALKAAETELTSCRTKVNELEARLSKDQKSLLANENQYRDQLTERNTLLLTIYQYMDKILGVDKTPKKGNSAETKPFTNFSVFHDNLITRLKALSQIQLDFDKRVKEAEARFTEKLTDMRRQLDTRWKQVDKFETSVKAYGDAKATWRRKYVVKEGELEALKATNSELAQQLTTARRPAQGDSQEIRSLLSRAVNAEKRLVVANNQLLQHEEKISTLNQKTSSADTKWEARVKEYEARLKAAEDKYKRERQGSKERVLELENQIKSAHLWLVS